MKINEALINQVIEAAKETAKIMIANGATSNQVFDSIIGTFGPEAGRLILIDLGMDLGKADAAKAYFNEIYSK